MRSNQVRESVQVWTARPASVAESCARCAGQGSFIRIACRQTQRTDESCINLNDERHRPAEGIGGSPDRLCRAVCIVCRVSSVCILSILHCVRCLLACAPLLARRHAALARSGAGLVGRSVARPNGTLEVNNTVGSVRQKRDRTTKRNSTNSRT
jgi:hypothetical protein